MRVAVRHTDESHENHGWFAFEQGRILGFTDPMTGESYTPEVIADALLKRAQAQFPADEGYEHQIETIHSAGVDDDGHPVAEWHPIGESDLPRLGAPGTALPEEVLVAQGQDPAAE